MKKQIITRIGRILVSFNSFAVDCWSVIGISWQLLHMYLLYLSHIYLSLLYLLILRAWHMMSEMWVCKLNKLCSLIFSKTVNKKHCNRAIVVFWRIRDHQNSVLCCMVYLGYNMFCTHCSELVFYAVCVFSVSCQYQCSQLPGMTDLGNGLWCIECDIKPTNSTVTETCWWVNK